jgi:hypothetical protein
MFVSNLIKRKIGSNRLQSIKFWSIPAATFTASASLWLFYLLDWQEIIYDITHHIKVLPRRKQGAG